MTDEPPPAVRFSRTGLKQLRSLNHSDQRRIKDVLGRFAAGGRADLRKLAGRDDVWAIRVSRFRVLFTFQQDPRVLFVHEVLDRRESYQDRS